MPANAASSTADRTITQHRIFDAPQELVWNAWTDPRHVDRWWGPNGFTTTTTEMEVRPGGLWRFTMHGPDGTDWPNLVTFIEVVEPERLVYDHGDGGVSGRPDFHVTVTFTDHAGTRTELTMESVFPTVEAAEAVKKFGAEELGKQTLARLAEYLLQMQP